MQPLHWWKEIYGSYFAGYNPSIFCFVNSPKKRKAEEDLHRFSRLRESKKRRVERLGRERVEAERKQEESTEKQYLDFERGLSEEQGITVEELSGVERHYSSCYIMTELLAENLAKAASDGDILMEEISQMKGENAALQKQIATLKEAMVTSESLKHNDAKVKYYTGLPSYGVLKVVFDFVSPCVTNYSRTSLPLIDQFNGPCPFTT